MKPTIGRIVHYNSYGTPGGEFKPQPRAAIVTDIVDGNTISLCAINPEGFFFLKKCEYSENPEPGCWSWPPRE